MHFTVFLPRPPLGRMNSHGDDEALLRQAALRQHALNLRRVHRVNKIDEHVSLVGRRLLILRHVDVIEPVFVLTFF